MRSIELQKELFRPSLYLITAGPLTFPCQQPQCISPINWCTWPQLICCQSTALSAECLIVASQSPNYSLKHINIWFLYPVAVYWIFFYYYSNLHKNTDVLYKYFRSSTSLPHFLSLSISFPHLQFEATISILTPQESGFIEMQWKLHRKGKVN